MEFFYVTIKNLMKTDSGSLLVWKWVRFWPRHIPRANTAVTPRPHVSTTLPNLSATSPNISTTFLASGDISGLMVWTSVGLVVMVTVLGLVLLLFYRQRRGTRRTPPPPPVSSNTQPDPTGEVDCVYEEIREADRQTDTTPVVISSVHSTVNSPTNSITYPAGKDSTTYPAGLASKTYPAGLASTTYPAGLASTTYPASQASTTYPAGLASKTYTAGQASTTYPASQASTTYPASQASTTYPAGRATGVPHCDIYANAICHKDYINPGYSTADRPASLIYSNVDLPKDSRVSSSPPTASGTQDDSIYSTD
ncbi:unnamed protein product [Coregonus sp. 'balchen']|nr:unnamed protein product [Coregonus sp. 'balchen']